MALLQDIQNQMEIAATVAFIQDAHSDQKYGNMPYFFHPVEVADEVIQIAMFLSADDIIKYQMPALHDIQLAALLHDVLEDTKYTEEQLLERFSPDVVKIVKLMSHDKDGMSYLEYIQMLIDSGNIGAMLVKLADNRVNRRGDKSSFKPEKAQRLNDRYDASMEMLTDALNRMGIQV